jgi:hypothetical protein
MSKKLKRTRQCKKCPWKVSTNPRDIPNGYCETKHANLKKTIATPGELNLSGGLNIMACHETNDAHCIGWLMNQLGPGNNIGLRLKMRDYDFSKVKLVGEQHERFEDTLPK